MITWLKRIVAGAIALTIILSLLLSLAACTANDPLAEQFRSGDNKNYIAGDGTVTEFALDQRPAVGEWSGFTESGDPISSDQLAGIVTVMNFWYAGCAPCRAEAPDLADLYREFLPSSVQFLGVNVRDTAETALAFDRNFGIEYPSVMDVQSGAVSLALQGVVSPQAVPTTLVIDHDGRVSARILGRIDAGILRTLIQAAVDRRDGE